MEKIQGQQSPPIFKTNCYLIDKFIFIIHYYYLFLLYSIIGVLRCSPMRSSRTMFICSLSNKAFYSNFVEQLWLSYELDETSVVIDFKKGQVYKLGRDIQRCPLQNSIRRKSFVFPSPMKCAQYQEICEKS